MTYFQKSSCTSIFMIALLLIDLPVVASSTVLPGQQQEGKRGSRLKTACKVAAVIAVGVLVGGVLGLRARQQRMRAFKEFCDQLQQEFDEKVEHQAIHEDCERGTICLDEDQVRGWYTNDGVPTSGLARQEYDARREAMQREAEGIRRRAQQHTQRVRQLVYAEYEARGKRQSGCGGTGIVGQEDVARANHLEVYYSEHIRPNEPKQRAWGQRWECGHEAERAYRLLQNEERKECSSLTSYYERNILPYLQIIRRQVDERAAITTQEAEGRGWVWPHDVAGIEAEQQHGWDEIMCGHTAYLQELENRRRAVREKFCTDERNARRCILSEEDRLRAERRLTSWLIRTFMQQGQFVPRGTDVVIPIFSDPSIRRVAKAKGVLSAAQLNELELRELLGLPMAADHDAVKRSYRSDAAQNHPDKTRTLSVSERAQRQEKFQKIADLYAPVDERARLYQLPSEAIRQQREEALKDMQERHHAEREMLDKQMEEEREREWQRIGVGGFFNFGSMHIEDNILRSSELSKRQIKERQDLDREYALLI